MLRLVRLLSTMTVRAVNKNQIVTKQLIRINSYSNSLGYALALIAFYN